MLHSAVSLHASPWLLGRAVKDRRRERRVRWWDGDMLPGQTKEEPSGGSNNTKQG